MRRELRAGLGALTGALRIIPESWSTVSSLHGPGLEEGITELLGRGHLFNVFLGK